jgi:hypothetical protein
MVINADKLLNKSSGKLAMQKAQQKKMVGGGPSNIVLSKKSIKGIEGIKINVIKIEDILKGSLALDKKQLDDKKKATSKKRKEDIETKLETKPNAESGGKVKLPAAPRMGILDFIKNFIGNVLLGYFAVRLIKHLPKIMPILKFLGNAADFIIDTGGFLLNGLATFLDIGYKAYDATRGFLKSFGGENFVKVFDAFNGAVGSVIEAAIIASIALASQGKDGVLDIGMDLLKDRLLGQGAQSATQAATSSSASAAAGGGASTAGGTAAQAGGLGAGAVAAVVAGAGLLSSALGEGAFQVRKFAVKPIQKLENDQKNDKNPFTRFGRGVALNMIRPLFGLFQTVGVLLDIVGAPFRYAIELLRYPFLSEEDKVKQAGNLAKFDARIREDFRKALNMVTLGFAFKEKGSFGNIYGNKGAQKEMMGKMQGGGIARGGRSRGRVKRTLSKGKYKRVLAPQKPLKTELKTEAFTKNKNLKESTEELDKTKYFGPILAISSKIMNKEEPTDRDYQNVGLGINLLIAKGIQDGQLKGGIIAKFAGGGLVDPDVLSAAETGGDISNWVAKTFRGAIETGAQRTMRLMKEMREEKTVPGSGGGGGDDPGGTIELKGNMASKSVQLAKRLQQMFGLKDFQAAAIVGTWLREGFGSGYPDVKQGGERGAPTYDAPSTSGYGFAQWTNTQGGGPNDRLNRAMIFLGMKDNPRPWTVDDNLKVFKWEIETKGYGSAISKLKETTNIRDAVRTFVGIYEAGGMKNIAKYEGQEGGGFIERRLSEAQGVLKYLVSGKDAQGKPLEQAVLGDANLSSGDGSFIQGNSGASDGTHFHIGTNKPGDASGSTSAAFSTIKHFLGKKSVYVGRSKETIPAGATDDEIRGYIARGMSAHATRGRGQTEVDLQVGGIGAGNKVAFPLGLSGIKYSSSDGYGTSGNITGTNAFVGHGRYKPDGTLAAQQRGVLNTGAPDFYFAKGGRIHKPIIAMIGEKGPEFVFDANTTAGLDKLAPQLLEKLNFASTKPQLASILQSYASYDTMSPQTIVVQSPSAPSGGRNNNSSGGGVAVIPIPVDNFTEILAMIG